MLYPMLCEPKLVAKIWGGRKMSDLFAIPLPEGEAIGEAWTVADLPEGESRIANGPFAGLGLGEVRARLGADLCGSAASADRFPLLVKLLDAADDLSVQVHPGEADCIGPLAACKSKDEAWYILDSDQGTVLHGFREGVSAADFHAAIDADRSVDVLRRVPVCAGDVIRVSPGTVHAICRGVVLLEIQEPSDTTFRVSDYGRLGTDGKPRDLHVSESKQVAKACEGEAITAPLALAAGHELLCDAPNYRIERLRSDTDLRWQVAPRGPQIVTITAGRGSLQGQGVALEMSLGQSAILPAAIGSAVFVPQGECEFILAGLGGEQLFARA